MDGNNRMEDISEFALEAASLIHTGRMTQPEVVRNVTIF